MYNNDFNEIINLYLKYFPHILQMGNQYSKLAPEKLPPEYREIPLSNGLYENIFDQSKILEHQLELKSHRDMEHQKSIFVFRKLHADKVVTAFYFSNENQSKICSNGIQICYFTQFPANRLSSFNTIAFEKGFQILVECLKGYSVLYEKFGYFKVTPDTLCFDHHNRVKVWISPNFAITRLPCSIIKKSQEYMIKQIFVMMDEKLDITTSRFSFSQILNKYLISQKKTIKFEEIRCFLINSIHKYVNLNIKQDFLLQNSKQNKKPFNKQDKSNNPKIKSLKSRKKSAETYKTTHETKQNEDHPKNKHIDTYKRQKTRRYNSQEIHGNIQEQKVIFIKQIEQSKPTIKIEQNKKPQQDKKILIKTNPNQDNFRNTEILHETKLGKKQYLKTNELKKIEKINSKYVKEFQQTDILEEDMKKNNKGMLTNLKTVKSIIDNENFSEVEDYDFQMIELEKPSIGQIDSLKTTSSKYNINK